MFKFIELKHFNISICIESEGSASIFPKVIGLRGLDLVLKSLPTVAQLEKVVKISVLIPMGKKYKNYETIDFRFFKKSQSLELVLDKRSRRELRQDLISAKCLKTNKMK